MTVSSRTPEGEANCCPICGKHTRTDPSTTPTRDAPCPHCGSLLWFAEVAPRSKGPRRSKSYEGAVLAAGRRRFGSIPTALVLPLLEAVRLIVAARHLREPADVEVLVQPATSWADLTYRLRRMAGLKSSRSWVRSALTFFRRHFRRGKRSRALGVHA